MNSKQKTILDKTVEYAKGNSTQLPQMAATIVIKNEIVSVGFNQKRTHPFQKLMSGDENKIHIHAEMDALNKALKVIKREDLKKATMFVARVLKNGCKAKAKPCMYCAKALERFNLSAVYWTEYEQ